MSLTETIDSLLRDSVSRGDVPGVVAAVTDRDATLYQGAFGERALGGATAMTMDSVGWLASMTKPLTAAAAMQLVERGMLALDQPASDWIPALDKVQVLEGFKPSGAPITRAPAGPITLRHLLTHTAGFGYEKWSRDIARFLEVEGLPAIGSCELAALGTPLLFDPGTRWNYGIGIDWAGRMVEAASGRTLGRVLREQLFEPLGMTSTAFKISDGMRARLATVHQRDEDGALRPIDFEVPQAPEFEMGGGGLYGTVGDYLKFLRMILNDGAGPGPRILRPSTVATMSRNQMGDSRVRSLVSVDPVFSNDIEFFPGMDKTWGLSFMINVEAAASGRGPGSLAWAGLANTYFWIDPAAGIGAVYLTQIFPFADKKSLALFEALEAAVYRSLG